MGLDSRRGSLLIVALWSLSLMAVFAVGLGAGVRQKAALSRRLEAEAQLVAAARSGVDAARALLTAIPKEAAPQTLLDEWAASPSQFKQVALTDRTAFSVVSPAGSLRRESGSRVYGLEDEERKLNLNTADAATITRLFLKIGAASGSQEAEALAYAVVDWRDGDSAYGHPNFGAEDDDYEDLRLPYEAKDLPFETTDELLLVKGINREFFDKIRPYVTVFGKGRVNLNTVSLEVLTAMGVNEPFAERILAYRRGEDGFDGTADDRIFLTENSVLQDLDREVPVSEADRAELEKLISEAKIGTESLYFTVLCEARWTASGAFVNAEAVVDRSGKVYTQRISRLQWPSSN